MSLPNTGTLTGGEIVRYLSAKPLSHRRGDDRFSELLAQYLSTRIAKSLLRRGIELDNRSLVVDTDNAIQRRIQYGPYASFALPQRLLRPLAFSDLALQLFVGGFELCGTFDNTVLQALIHILVSLLGARGRCRFPDAALGSPLPIERGWKGQVLLE